MASLATIVVVGLVLLAAIAGAVLGGGVVRLFVLKRLQRHYDEWRLDMRKELGALARAQEDNQSLQTQLRRQAEYIASLQTQLSRIENEREASGRPTGSSAGARANVDENGVPVLTRRAKLPPRMYRGHKVIDR